MAFVRQPLGQSIPAHDGHALSVTFPTWEDVVGYETGDPRVHEALECGYPRFFRHPQVKKLAQTLTARFCSAAEIAAQTHAVVVLPTQQAAERLHKFIVDNVGAGAEAADSPSVHNADDLVWVVRFPQSVTTIVSQFWQHTGEIVSSRHAEFALQQLQSETKEPALVRGTATHAALRERIASLYFPTGEQQNAQRDVLVYPTGMGAIFAAVRLLQSVHGSERKAILFGFPYVDTLKILHRTQWCLNGVHFFPKCGEKELQEVEQIVKREPILGIFTEFPGNPLLSTPDLGRLAKLAHEHGTALVVDDTIASYNVNVMNHGCADIVVTSLSKIFSGTCNVMGGSLVLNPASALYNDFQSSLAKSQAETGVEDSFIVEQDAKQLLATSVDIESRVARVNASTLVIAQRFKNHPLVKNVYYAGMNENLELYTRFLTPSKSESDSEDRFGSLLSVVLHGGVSTAQSFYDAMTIAKGPSLGTNFTLACPYTMIAHFHELEFVESCGVDRNLIRISIGLEDVEQIWQSLLDALTVADKVYVPSSA